jgi:hypothetical protein
VDQAVLDRLCDDLRSRRSSLGEAPAELARLRGDGYSVVESTYIIAKVFELPLADAKALAVAGESREHLAQIEALHDRLEKDVQG